MQPHLSPTQTQLGGPRLPLMLCWHVHHLFCPHWPACYHRLQRLRLLLLGAPRAMGTRLHRFLSALHLFIHQAILRDADEKVRPRRADRHA